MAEPYVFISYSRDDPDADYVAALVTQLCAAGVQVWYDEQLVSGDRWERELRARVDGCAALIVVMSPRSEASSWVQLEVGRARYRGRPVRPLLLAGRVFARLADIQYEIVPSRQILPSADFVDRLRADLAASTRPEQRRSALVVGRAFPPRNPHFIGRAKLLLDLETNLYWGRSVAVEALHGTGGVGKTQLAAEYAHRRRDDYDLIAWIDSERPELIAGQVAELAAALGVPTDEDLGRTAEAVVAALGDTDRFWLVVFDNAERPEHIRPWLPRSGAGRVIVTSRQRGWDGLGSTVDVDVMSRDESVALLHLSVASVDDRVAGDIADLLGDLPLAVEQAAGYLVTTGVPAEDYLRLLRARSEELLDSGHVLGYEHTVATVWDVSQASLHEASPAAEQLLRVCAFLGPELIPLGLVTQHAEVLPVPLSHEARDEVRFVATVGALVSRSLARRGTGGLTVHRLLSAAVRRLLPDSERQGWKATAARLIQSAMPDGLQAERDPANWPILARLLPHALYALDPASPKLGTLANYLGYIGDHGGQADVLLAHAEGYSAQDAENRRVYGPHDKLTLQGYDVTLITYVEAARALGEARRDDEAITLLRRILDEAKSTLGIEHNMISYLTGELSDRYREGGHWGESITLHEQMLADMREALGLDHAQVLSAQLTAAHAYRMTHDYPRTIALLEQTVAGARRTLGPDEHFTLYAQELLGDVYGLVGQHDLAIELLEQTLEARTRQGVGNPGKLRNDLATAYRRAGQTDKAIAIYEDALAEARRTNDDSTIMAMRHSLAQAYWDAGRADSAISLCEQIYEKMQSRSYRSRDPLGRLAGQRSLAGDYLRFGQPNRAIDAYERLLAESRLLLGNEHEDTLANQYFLADAYAGAGRLSETIELYEQTLTESRRVLGPDHWIVRSITRKLQEIRG